MITPPLLEEALAPSVDVTVRCLWALYVLLPMACLPPLITTCQPACSGNKLRAAASDARAIGSAAELFLIDHPGRCPTVDDLVAARILDPRKRLRDPWDHPFAIDCGHGQRVCVVSAGPDQVFDTDDDVPADDCATVPLLVAPIGGHESDDGSSRSTTGRAPGRLAQPGR